MPGAGGRENLTNLSEVASNEKAYTTRVLKNMPSIRTTQGNNTVRVQIYINSASVKLAREAENAWRFGTGYECEDDGRNDGV